MNSMRLLPYALLWVFLLVPSRLPAAGKVTAQLDKENRKITVKVDGKLFTEYLYEGQNRPILYPVLGPGGEPMTRNYPMKKGVPNEASDHPHHRSLWYTHGEVNGISFWHDGSNTGKILQDEIISVESGPRAEIETRNRWVDAGGETVLTDTRTLGFFVDEGGARVIDFRIDLHASHGKVLFGDTKEGSMGIRTNPLLRLSKDERRGVKKVTGKALNSEGHRDRELWGKRAKWVDYWGKIDGATVGVAIFDHPSNPRHPTWWHARHYGLVAANPFGIHNFENKKKGVGDLEVAGGETLTFRYRFVFHEGDARQAKIARRYQEFADSK